MAGGAGAARETILHGSCVAHRGRALLITGAAGRGKSQLALAMMALGAALVADDRTLIRVEAGRLVADCPPAIAGLIEMRGLGLLRAEPAGPAPLAAVLDLDRAEPARLPPPRQMRLLGQSVPLLWRPNASDLAPGLMQFLGFGRQAP